MCRNMLFFNVKVKKVESRWTGSWVLMYSVLGFRPFRPIESYALTDHRASFVVIFTHILHCVQ